MVAIAFDSHAFIKRLTTADIADVRRDIELAKHELTTRTGAMVVALGGFLAAIKLFGH